jgi:pyridoxal biosynthesis lyase PdxS
MGRKSLDERIREVQERWAKIKAQSENGTGGAGVVKGRSKAKRRKRRSLWTLTSAEEDVAMLIEASNASTVYFIRVGDDGPIKIGRTNGNPLARLAALQISSPFELRIIATIAPAGVMIENGLHRLFSHLHIRGEWFSPEPELLEYIATNAEPWRMTRWAGRGRKSECENLSLGKPCRDKDVR